MHGSIYLSEQDDYWLNGFPVPYAEAIKYELTKNEKEIIDYQQVCEAASKYSIPKSNAAFKFLTSKTADLHLKVTKERQFQYRTLSCIPQRGVAHEICFTCGNLDYACMVIADCERELNDLKYTVLSVAEAVFNEPPTLTDSGYWVCFSDKFDYTPPKEMQFDFVLKLARGNGKRDLRLKSPLEGDDGSDGWYLRRIIHVWHPGNECVKSDDLVHLEQVLKADRFNRILGVLVPQECIANVRRHINSRPCATTIGELFSMAQW